MEETVTLNTVILPSPEIEEEAYRMSNLLSEKFPTHFRLDKENFVPHISLYHAKYPAENIDKIIHALSEKVSRMNPFEVFMNDLALVFGTFIVWNCEKKQNLQQLHETIIETVNPLRNDLALKHASEFKDPYDKELVEKYGTVRIFKTYSPHITLTRTISEIKEIDVANIIGSAKKMSFTAKQIAVGHLKEHGTVHNIIGTFPFGRS